MPTRLDRRSFLTRGALAAASLAAAGGGAGTLLGACSGAGSSPGTTSAGRPRRGGTLVFGVEAEESGFDPATARFDSSGVNYARAVFDPLTIVAADGSIQPYLAQAVTPNDDYSVWTITLRPNVVFHDGSVCDAQAVTMSFEHFLSNLYGITVTPPFHKVTPTGTLEVTITMTQPWVPFPAYLAGGIGGQVAWIVAPSMIKGTNGFGAGKPAGTGPFVFSQWTMNDHFTATRNPHYWRAGLPYLDSITYKPVADAAARDQAFTTGVLDAMHTSDPQSIQKLRQQTSSYFYRDDAGHVIGEPDMGCLLLNEARPPFDDYNVRRAVAMTVDVEEYVASIDYGVNAVSHGPFTADSPYAPSSTSYPKLDRAAARALISEAQAAGKSVSFTLTTTTSQADTRAIEFIQQQLEQIGMQVQLQNLEQAEQINNALAGSYQANLWRQFAAIDPDLNYIFWSPTEILPGLAVDMSRNRDQAIENALQQGRRNADPSVRHAAYQEVARRFADDLPYVWLDRAVWAVAAQQSVHGLDTPTTPEGAAAYPFIAGTFWPAQVWRT